jgi:hypothetical protein
MKVKEFYDFITSKMTAEQALLKLLEGSVIQYDRLKFDEANQPVHPTLIILMAVMDLGWAIAFDADSPEIEGLSAGTIEYMDKLFAKEIDVRALAKQYPNDVELGAQIRLLLNSSRKED